MIKRGQDSKREILEEEREIACREGEQSRENKRKKTKREIDRGREKG